MAIIAVYSSGRMSKAHAVLEKECAACHLRTVGAFSVKAADAAFASTAMTDRFIMPTPRNL